MQRVAIIYVDDFALPPRSGMEVRYQQVIEALKSSGWDVVIATRRAHGVPGLRVIRHQPARLDRLIARLLYWWHRVTGSTPGSRSFMRVPFGHRLWLRNLARRLNARLIVIEVTSNAALRPPNVPTILDLPDLARADGQLWRGMAALIGEGVVDPQAVNARLLRLDPVGVRDAAHTADVKLVRGFHRVLTVAEADAIALNRRGDLPQVDWTPINVAPLALQNTYDQPPLLPIADNPFNLHGYIWFVRCVLPLVRAEHPDFELRVAGSGSERIADSEGVRRLGHVLSLNEEYAKAAFLIDPVWLGTGQPVKVVHAMAHGLAVVTTRHGAARTPIRDGQDGIVAGDARSFAAALNRLISDKALAARMGSSARQRMAEVHAADPLVDLFRRERASLQRVRR